LSIEYESLKTNGSVSIRVEFRPALVGMMK